MGFGFGSLDLGLRSVGVSQLKGDHFITSVKKVMFLVLFVCLHVSYPDTSKNSQQISMNFDQFQLVQSWLKE